MNCNLNFLIPVISNASRLIHFFSTIDLRYLNIIIQLFKIINVLSFKVLLYITLTFLNRNINRIYIEVEPRTSVDHVGKITISFGFEPQLIGVMSNFLLQAKGEKFVKAVAKCKQIYETSSKLPDVKPVIKCKIKPSTAVQDFVKKVTSNTFVTRDDPTLKEKFYFFVDSNEKGNLVHQLDKTLALNLGRDFETFANEIIHVFLTALKYGERTYIIENQAWLNPRDIKSGDLMVANTDIRIEAKTYNKLTLNQALDIIRQYRYDTNIDRITFSILYKENCISEEEFVSKLAEININPKNVILTKESNLKELLNDENHAKFFNLYDIPEDISRKELYDANKKTAEDVITYSKDKNARKHTMNYLKKLEQKNSNLGSEFAHKLDKLTTDIASNNKRIKDKPSVSTYDDVD